MDILNGARVVTLHPMKIRTLARTSRTVFPFRWRSSRRITCNMPKLAVNSASMQPKTKYTDSWIDTVCIDYLARCIEKESGNHSELQGY
eukprot:c49658_g1_i1 orf=269-535(+)